MLFGLAAALTLAAPAAAQTAQEQVVAQLRAQGYRRIRISRTLLGRVRILAVGPAGKREVVLNPATGAILRDYVDRDDDSYERDQRDDDGPDEDEEEEEEDDDKYEEDDRDEDKDEDKDDDDGDDDDDDD